MPPYHTRYCTYRYMVESRAVRTNEIDMMQDRVDVVKQTHADRFRPSRTLHIPHLPIKKNWCLCLKFAEDCLLKERNTPNKDG